MGGPYPCSSYGSYHTGVEAHLKGGSVSNFQSKHCSFLTGNTTDFNLFLFENRFDSDSFQIKCLFDSKNEVEEFYMVIFLKIWNKF